MYDRIDKMITVFDLEDSEADSEPLVFSVHTDSSFYLTIDRDERESYGEHKESPSISLMLSESETKALSDFLLFALYAKNFCFLLYLQKIFNAFKGTL